MSESQLPVVLGQLPSGLFILTARRDDTETGVLVSWIQQAGFEPPAITVAVRQGRPVAEWLAGGVPFVINLIGENQKALIGHFGRGFEPHESAFDGLKIHHTADKIPILTDALGYLECRPVRFMDSGDHRIFLAEIVAGQVTANGKPYVHIRKNGLKY